MLIGEDLDFTSLRNHDPNELGDLLLDRLGVGTTEGGLKEGPASFLFLGHPTLPAQFCIGEGIEEVGVSADSDVEVAGIVLAELEGLEAVDDHRFPRRLGSMQLLKEQAMAA